MDKIIGLGTAGCNLANKFKQYVQYDVFNIDAGINCENCLSLEPRNSHEEYERNSPSLQGPFLGISGDILVTLSSGRVSGSTLRILYQLRHCNINILYIKPDGVLNKVAMMQDKVTMQVLQEYTRSGLFKRMFLVNNTTVEGILGDVPIIGYYDKLNDTISTTLHQINKAQHIKPIVDQTSPPKVGNRISTYGLFNIETGEEKLFFPIDNVKEKCYYLFINRKKLETDGKLMRQIREIISAKSTETIKTGFAIYSTEHNTDYCYVMASTDSIQSS